MRRHFPFISFVHPSFFFRSLLLFIVSLSFLFALQNWFFLSSLLFLIKLFALVYLNYSSFGLLHFKLYFFTFLLQLCINHLSLFVCFNFFVINLLTFFYKQIFYCHFFVFGCSNCAIFHRFLKLNISISICSKNSTKIYH